MSEIFCNSTRDCFDDLPLAPRFCSQTINVSVCQCSAYYGWKGEDCDEASGFLIYLRIVSTIFLIWSFMLIIVTCRNVLCTVIFEGVKVNSLSITAYSVFAASICAFLFVAFRFPAFFDYEYFEIIIFQRIFSGAEFEDVDVKLSQYSYSFFMVAALFASTSSLFLVISWQDIVTRISTYKSYQAGRMALLHMKVLRILLLVTYLLLLFTLVFQDFLSSLVLVTGIAVIVALSFIFISWSFIGCMSTLLSSSSTNSLLSATVSYVKKIRSLVIFSWSLIAVAVLSYALVIRDSNDNVSPGDFNPIAIFRDLIIFSYLFQFTTIAWYVNSVSVAPIVSENYCPCFSRIFKYWDNMNQILIPEELVESFAIKE